MTPKEAKAQFDAHKGWHNIEAMLVRKDIQAILPKVDTIQELWVLLYLESEAKRKAKLRAKPKPKSKAKSKAKPIKVWNDDDVIRRQLIGVEKSAERFNAMVERSYGDAVCAAHHITFWYAGTILKNLSNYKDDRFCHLNSVSGAVVGKMLDDHYKAKLKQHPEPLALLYTMIQAEAKRYMQEVCNDCGGMTDLPTGDKTILPGIRRRGKKYQVYETVGGKQIIIGTFRYLGEAILAQLQFNRKVIGWTFTERQVDIEWFNSLEEAA